MGDCSEMEAPAVDYFCVGYYVQLRNLVENPTYNGTMATLLRQEPHSDIWIVQLHDQREVRIGKLHFWTFV